MRIKNLDNDSWSIEGKQFYLVQRERIDGERCYRCSCPDYFYRKSKLAYGACKHIHQLQSREIERLEIEIYKNV